jgi:hypothetical protein
MATLDRCVAKEPYLTWGLMGLPLFKLYITVKKFVVSFLKMNHR